MTTNELQKFKDILLDSPWLKLLQSELPNNDQILFIFINGSTLLNLDLEDSDIDIEIGTLYHSSYSSVYNGQYKNRSIHGGYKSITKDYLPSLDNFCYPSTVGSGFYLLRYFTIDKIIYINPLFPKIPSIFMSYLQSLSNFGLYLAYYQDIDFLGTRANQLPLAKYDWIGLDYYYIFNNKLKDNEYYQLYHFIKHHKIKYDYNNNILNQKAHTIIQKSLNLFLKQMTDYDKEVGGKFQKEILNYIREVEKNANI